MNGSIPNTLTVSLLSGLFLTYNNWLAAPTKYNVYSLPDFTSETIDFLEALSKVGCSVSAI